MRKFMVAIAVLSFAALTGCTSSKSPVEPVAPVMSGQVQLQLTDAPGNFDAVNLVISEVAVNTASGWQVLDTQLGTVNLLSLQGAKFATLAAGSVPVGQYSQVRLKLGEGSTVVVDGVSHPLTVPSGMTSGVKIDGSFDVVPGGVISLQLDFDAAKSIHLTGSGVYTMTPVIRMLPATAAGAITGSVVNADPGTTVELAYGDTGDLVASAAVASDGHFGLAVLPPGLYTLTFTTSTGRLWILQDVPVTAGQTLTLHPIALRGV